MDFDFYDEMEEILVNEIVVADNNNTPSGTKDPDTSQIIVSSSKVISK